MVPKAFQIFGNFLFYHNNNDQQQVIDINGFDSSILATDTIVW
jgi:hypothetical protein